MKLGASGKYTCPRACSFALHAELFDVVLITCYYQS